MKDTADIYSNVILRAVLGSRAHECKVADPARLRQIAEHLVECEDAKAALQAKGYGLSGMSFMELVRAVPENAYGRLRNLFRKHAATPVSYPSLGEAGDSWSAQ